MELRVEEIRYKNIREFRDLELDFTRPNSTDPHHVSLVQMPNGTGKTTTMKLIRHILLGRDLDPEEVRDFKPRGFDAVLGQFVLGFATEEDRFRLFMELDYRKGSVRYQTAHPEREGGGKNVGHTMPFELEDALTEQFVELFVFNGELTDDFLETDKNKAENALKIVNRFDQLEAQVPFIERIVEEQQERRGGASTPQGLSQNKTKLDKRRRALRDLKAERDEINADIRGISNTIEAKQEEREEIMEENEEVLEEYKELEEEISMYKQELNTHAGDALSELRKPSRVSEEFTGDFASLVEQMSILKLPKSTSEEFFTELAESETCVCGRKVTEEHREKIRNNADHYLSEEDIGVLNALKEQLRNVSDVADLDATFDEIRSIRTNLKKAQMRQDGLDLEDPELEARKTELTEQIEQLKFESEEKRDILDLITTDDKGKRDRYDLAWRDNIVEAKREVKKYRDKVETATSTVAFSKKADKLSNILDTFISRSLGELKRDQIARTNERLTQILGLSEVQIGSIEESIQLEGRSGSSEGQALSVAYAYLSTLFEGSAVDLPFIIDSPAVSLDHKVRREVASIITDLFDQPIAFVISTEKEGFVESLEPRQRDGEADIQYYTIHKTETPGEVKKHTDEEFFMEFTSEEEANEPQDSARA